MSQEAPETKPQRAALMPLAQQRSEFLRNCRALPPKTLRKLNRRWFA